MDNPVSFWLQSSCHFGMTIQEIGIESQGARFEIRVPSCHYRFNEESGVREAVEAFDQGLKIDPAFSSALVNKNLVLFEIPTVEPSPTTSPPPVTKPEPSSPKPPPTGQPMQSEKPEGTPPPFPPSKG